MLSLVHGVSFRQEACLRAYRTESKKPKCWLEAEPDNVHDCHAVKVFVNGEHVGYIPRKIARRVDLTDKPTMLEMGKYKGTVFFRLSIRSKKC